MSAQQNKLLTDIAHVREMAHRLLAFSRILPPHSHAFNLGWTLAEMVCSLVEQDGDVFELAWLIEVSNDFSSMLAATLREEHLAKSDAG
jgi:hypothetical protein